MFKVGDRVKAILGVFILYGKIVEIKDLTLTMKFWFGNEPEGILTLSTNFFARVSDEEWNDHVGGFGMIHGFEVVMI